MSVQFQDYYKTLGVDRKASSQEIQKAFRKLARKFHPDINKEAGAEDQFKKINEANEVLSDPEKRQQYDALGANWKSGQEFRPPPNWGGSFSGGEFQEEGDAFSDFFRAFFSGANGGDTRRQFTQGSAGDFSQGFGGFGGGFAPQKGQDLEALVDISLSEAINGSNRQLGFEVSERNPDGTRSSRLKSYQVKIPKGTRDGQTIRLTGQGGTSGSGGPAGDLLLKVRIRPEKGTTVQGDDIIRKLPLAPWDAALGVSLTVPTLDGEVRMTIPAGTTTGKKFRIPKRGLPKRAGERGDFFVEIVVEIPPTLSDRERELFQQLKESSTFNPRG